MISSSEALVIAERYTAEKGEILPGIRYGVGDMQEYEHCYYFDFTLVFANQPESDVAYGGAAGFALDKKSGEVKAITFSQLADMRSYTQPKN